MCRNIYYIMWGKTVVLTFVRVKYSLHNFKKTKLDPINDVPFLCPAYLPVLQLAGYHRNAG